jgi:ATP phosphoribosyltransferase regulatory subunit
MTDVMKYEERVVFALRELYRRCGYQQFKMRKFEEYDLYARNKDFLVSDNIITFTDLNGALMALKPDVTLSIVRSSRDGAGVQKVYYNENVYRVSGGARCFREILQTGVECIGDVDDCCIAETLMLAIESLKLISPDCVLDLSHLDIVSALVDALGVEADVRRDILKCIGEKNLHELDTLCAGCDAGAVARLKRLVQTSGAPAEVLPALRALDCAPEAVAQLASLTKALEALGLGDYLRIDFSVVNDMNYYNGVVFKGFVSGVPAGVLSGGQYDKLMRKMHRAARAIGFAVYLDMLERLDREPEAYDVDTVLLYDDGTDPAALLRAVAELSADGGSVSAQKCVPEKLRCRRVLHLVGNEVRP